MDVIGSPENTFRLELNHRMGPHDSDWNHLKNAECWKSLFQGRKLLSAATVPLCVLPKHILILSFHPDIILVTMSFLGLGDFFISSKVQRRAGLALPAVCPGGGVLCTAAGSRGGRFCSYLLPAQLEQ